MEQLDGITIATNKATQYEKTYLEQINLGRSELFAHHYADMIADREAIVFAHYYATAYVEAFEKGKSDEYAGLYALMLGEIMVNQYSSVAAADNDEESRIYLDETKGYMKGWEYAKEQKLKDAKEFIVLYQNEYLNTCYADTGRPNIPDEELDRIVLEKTLKKFNRTKEK
jgi:hypothetical protein